MKDIWPPNVRWFWGLAIAGLGLLFLLLHHTTSGGCNVLFGLVYIADTAVRAANRKLPRAAGVAIFALPLVWMLVGLALHWRL